jgi:3'(2'), 5'-bisphosphate nucleotidase
VKPLQAIAGTPVEDMLAIVRSLGWGATKILRAYYRGEPFQDGTERLLNIQNKKDGPVTAADMAVNHYVLDRLHKIFDDQTFGYLSEETYSGQSEPLPQDWVWILDPLDGTRDFIDQTGEYAFHLALTFQGRPMVAVVACPEAQRLYYAALGGGTFVETIDGATQQLHVSTRDRLEDLVVVVSRTHRDERFNQLLRRLPCQQQLSVGSVGGKIAAIADRRADVYISLSGKSAPKDWDIAAPELILTEAGGKFTHANGQLLRYNTGDVNQWGCLIASNGGSYHAELCTTAAQILAESDMEAGSKKTEV